MGGYACKNDRPPRGEAQRFTLSFWGVRQNSKVERKEGRESASEGANKATDAANIRNEHVTKRTSLQKRRGGFSAVIDRRPRSFLPPA